MKAKVTRILAIILALSVMVCCFSACGGKDEDETSSITWPTNPGDNSDVFVNDGSSLEDMSFEDMSNMPSDGGALNQGGSYYPSGGTNNSYPSGGTNNSYPSGGSSNSNSSSTPTLDSIQSEVEHFFTHFDTPEEREEVLKLAGYEYDEGQDIYYTHLNPWQRHFGFTDLYDQAAPLTNMWYLTLKIDFRYNNLLWRLQWWKGQYGILEGAELGVYTKKPGDNSAFYKCAEDGQLLRMTMDYYHSWSDYKAGNRLFTRAEQEHWWLTGFKFGVVSPKKNVVRATLYAYNDRMADGIEAGLKNVTDNKGSWNGFVPYKAGTTEQDFYIRNGNRFSVVWYEAGYLNYNIPENPQAPNPDVNLPEEPSTQKPEEPTTQKPEESTSQKPEESTSQKPEEPSSQEQEEPSSSETVSE